MVERALANPYAVVVGVLAVLVVGAVCLTRVPIDLLPIFPTPAVQIVTFYPGMPPEVMERDIMARLQRWTGQSTGIARQEGKAMLGVSIVKNFFHDDVDYNTAMSQVTSYAMSDLFYLPPGTIPPMVMPFDPTATIPLCLLSVSSPSYDETKLYDIAYFDLRNRLQGIGGVIAPAVYGGKLRRILAYVDRDRLHARNLSPMDVVRALKDSNVFIPTGDVRFGEMHYFVNANGMVSRVEELDEIPVKVESGAPVFLRDVGTAKDAYQIQTNIVRVDGRRQVYIPIYRQPGANTIRIVEGVKEATAAILSRLPKGIDLDVIMDQSVYVRQAIRSLVQEGVLGIVLAAGTILAFLGSFRSTLITALAIPLSLLAAVIGLSFTGNSVNAMTLGGMARVIGRLVDDAIVVLENTVRHLDMGKPPRAAALDGAREVAVPVLGATIATVAVFAPVVFLAGLGRYLFEPLALTVAFSMAASYVVALTVVPVCCAAFLGASAGDARGPRVARWFARLRGAYEAALHRALSRRMLVLGGAAALFAAALAALPWVGKELFPSVDAGQFTLRVRASSGTRLETTERLCAGVEVAIREMIPPGVLGTLITNIGVLNDWPAAYTPNSGPMDAFILVQLAPERERSTLEIVRELRPALQSKFPGVEFAFDTGGLITAALNFGLPSPIDIQVEGNRLDVAHDIAEKIRRMVAQVPGTVDVRIQQKIDYPMLEVEVDRTKAAYLGLTQRQVVTNIVTALNSSINFDPAFWIDERNGNHYFVGAQYAEPAIRSVETLEEIPVRGAGDRDRAVPLRNMATIRRATGPAEINHVNITRVTDVFANLDGRDVGGVAAEIEERLEREVLPDLPEGYFVHVRGEVASMKSSFQDLGIGFGLAVVLIFLVMVWQFRSFLDPLVVMLAVPLGLVGVAATLLATGTTLNVQSLLGVVFMVGIAVSNSILMVEFTNRLLEAGEPPARAVVQAAAVRLRPILMTSLAAVIALLPMAVGVGRGTEANVPLARAVVGGLLVSTALTLFVVPCLLMVVRARPRAIPGGS